MSKRRSPIDYSPKFAEGIFRPREVVESELAGVPARDTGRRPAATDDRKHPSERTNVAPVERTKIRHTFDIYRDQLQALAEIQAARFKASGRKPKMGDLVQEALDAYIEKTNVRSNERRG
jgi:hypothetical protein